MGKLACELYRDQALKAVDDWDGQSTSDLFLEICKATGEDPETVLAKTLADWQEEKRK